MAGGRSNELDATVDARSERDSSLDDTRAADGTTLGPPGSHPIHVLADRYRIGREIGRGGLGVVVAAHDAVLDRTVAIKEAADASGESRARFEREILVTARLQHPAIVPIYDAARWPDQAPFYAMKLVTGRPLSEAIEAARTLEERLGLLPNVLAVADAIAYAHGERVIHRDLKPQNVLVGAHGETIVIDWGIAKELDAHEPSRRHDALQLRGGDLGTTAAGALLGTPAYMAPEQATGRDVDERADVYALGAMLYHVVAGVGPHDGRTLEEVLRRIARGQIVPLATRAPLVPPELAAIVDKAMATSPADRYPTASELADDLRRYTTDQLVGAHRYTLAHRARRFVRRNAAAVVAVLLVGAFGAWTATSLAREQTNAHDAARLELELAVGAARRDISTSLDQASPMLDSLRDMADPELPLTQVGPRLHDLVVGRPGVVNASIGFPSGRMRGTFVAEVDGAVEVQESVVGEGGTTRSNHRIWHGGLEPVGVVHTEYDVRNRPHYLLATQTRTRAWTPPHTYFASRSTGISCTEPIYGDDGALRAVTTVDFAVGALSAIVAHPPFDGARAVLFSADGSVLAFPSKPVPEVAVKENRVLRHEDYGDPALDALFEHLDHGDAEVRFFELRATGDDYLVALAPLRGRRAGVETPLDWYVAAMAPSETLLGPARARGRRALFSLAAVAALAAAGAFAWRFAGRRRVRAAPPRQRT